ncbi:MAG: BNR repeat-containing protein [Burkholderiaceae bacterium]
MRAESIDPASFRALPPARVVELGRGWSGNTVNTVVFRCHGLTSSGPRQFGAYYIDAGRMVVFSRDAAGGLVQKTELTGQFKVQDAHDSISVGIDRLGYIHLAYDHHGSPLHYRRSLRHLDVSQFGPEIAMVGKDESQITYVSFIESAHGERPLLCLYRTGYAGRGDALLNAYDEGSGTWTRLANPLLSGSKQQPWTSSPYWNQPAVAPDGALELTFCWRTHPLCGDLQRVNNINIDIVRSPDWGQSWTTSRGLALRLPVTQVNAETILGLPPGSNLINQTGCAVDTQGNVHVVFYADDENGIPQYQHVWGRRGVWRRSILPCRTVAFALEGVGSLQLPISRPDIVIDDLDRAYVVFRADFTAQRMAVLRLEPPDYRFAPADIRILWDTDIGHTEPVIDRQRWAMEKTLSMLLQRNEQPDHDAGVETGSAAVFIADWNLGRDWSL